MSNEDVDAFLAHHGVLGMHWGIRKLYENVKDNLGFDEKKTVKTNDETRQVKLETSAKKHDSKAKIYDTKISELQAKTTKNRFQKHSVNKDIKDLTALRDIERKAATDKRQGNFTDHQKKVVVGASVVAALTVSAIAYNTIQSGNGLRLISKGRAFLKGTTASSWKKNVSLADEKMTIEELEKRVVSGCNPGYGAIGTKLNCRRSTFSYEMRRRGYDVTATRTTNARGQKSVGLYNALSPGKPIAKIGKGAIISRVLKDSMAKQKGKSIFTELDAIDALGKTGKTPIEKLVSDSNYGKDIFDSLSSQPERSRGELGVLWKAGGGHSMAWEIIGGKPVIFDTQTGQTYKEALDIINLGANIKEASFTRLDNVALNEDFLMRWIKNAA